MDWTPQSDNEMINAIIDGEINPILILWGYARGIFPMGDPETNEIDWYDPDPRGIIDLKQFHIPHSLRSILRNGNFRVTLSKNFREVMEACSQRETTWITKPIIDCYCELYKKGFAHSVEVWNGSQIVGGLYGVCVGGAFFGESMFHTQTHASKVALTALVQQLLEQRFQLLDIQFTTPHLINFGAEEISREDYLTRLSKAVSKKRKFVRPNQQTVEFP